MSEGQSTRLNSEVSEETHQATSGRGSASSAPRRSEEDNGDGWSATDGGSDADEDNNTIGTSRPSEVTSDPKSSARLAPVNPGYEGRARRGVSKAGGYDETPKRRGPRRKVGVRIRYVDDDERGGGTTEQGIRMGPVSVWRVVHGHRSEAVAHGHRSSTYSVRPSFSGAVQTGDAGVSQSGRAICHFACAQERAVAQAAAAGGAATPLRDPG